MSERFIDDRTRLSDFRDEILVVCPRCAKCARLVAVADLDSPGSNTQRLVCSTCFFDNTTDYMALFAASGRDLVDGYPLFLSAACAGEYLWAYNYRHLAWLERYVRATLRETRRAPRWGWCSQSAANRLPAWIKLAKNRQDILRGIAKIKRKSLARPF